MSKAERGIDVVLILLIAIAILLPVSQLVIWIYVEPKLERTIEGRVVNYKQYFVWLGTKMIPRTEITFATYGESEEILRVCDHWDFTIGKVYRITHRGGYPHFYRYIVDVEEM